MYQMNPYYAHESSVGHVFDVATWSNQKAFTMALVGMVTGAALAVATIYVWDPSLLVDHPPELLKSLNKEIHQGYKEYPWGMRIGLGVAGLLAFGLFATGVSSVFDAFSPNYYLRAGQGGLSMRLPNTVAWSKRCLESKGMQLDLPWREIASWTIIQKKELGALSPNAGNLDADMKIKTVDGQTHTISLDLFREPARIIYNRMQDAQQSVAAEQFMHPQSGSEVVSRQNESDEFVEASELETSQP